jgi:hypothetical protein
MGIRDRLGQNVLRSPVNSGEQFGERPAQSYQVVTPIGRGSEHEGMTPKLIEGDADMNAVEGWAIGAHEDDGRCAFCKRLGGGARQSLSQISFGLGYQDGGSTEPLLHFREGAAGETNLKLQALLQDDSPQAVHRVFGHFPMGARGAFRAQGRDEASFRPARLRIAGEKHQRLASGAGRAAGRFHRQTFIPQIRG